MTALPPRFDITRTQIEQVVAVFYARIRQHPELGPIFGNHVTDWPSHEAKIARFWANAILYERSYDGNPMQAHMAAGDVQAHHFTPWLALFEDVVSEVLPEQSAQAFSAFAHRIGRGLRMGVSDLRAPGGGVPSLH